MKIAILGIGGVGGFYGGKLAQHFLGNKNVEIIFIARGNHLEAIRSQGLKIIEGEKETVVHPAIATDDPSALGKFDVLLVSVKTYSLREAIRLVRNNINSETIIIPLVNGIEPYENLVHDFPEAKVFQGCCYLNAFIESPGVVKFRGGFEQILFGFPDDEKRLSVEKLFSKAGINFVSERDISKKVWEKFIFGSTVSSVGSLENESFGEIIANAERKKMLCNLIDECLLIANAKGIVFENDFAEKLIQKISTYPFEARTSMQLDFANGKRTELETFTGYILKCGNELGIDIPNYRRVYLQLRKKEKKFIRIISHSSGHPNLTCMSTKNMVTPMTDEQFISQRDRSVWIFKMLSLTPAKLVANDAVFIRLERASDFGELCAGDVLESMG
jgi:2-dehydropantoate 2-reductase